MHVRSAVVSERIEAEVAIVGAGPAGTAAAAHLGQLGVSGVVLVSVGVGDCVCVADVPDNELDPGPLQVRRVARVGELVEYADFVPSGLEPLGEVGADEPGAAGHENAHRQQAMSPRAAAPPANRLDLGPPGA